MDKFLYQKEDEKEHKKIQFTAKLFFIIIIKIFFFFLRESIEILDLNESQKIHILIQFLK